MAARKKAAASRKAPKTKDKRARKSSRKTKPAAKRRAASRKSAPPKPQVLPSRVQMLQLTGGYWVSQLLFVAAKLGIADQLAKGPLNAEALAERVGANARHLYRMLRALASLGVFAEDGQGRFKLTKLARHLRSDAKESLRDFVLMLVDDYNREAWGGLEYSVRSGRVAFDEVHKMPAFEYLKAHPEKDRQFSASMASISAGQNEVLARAYPFGRLSTLVDVGGAHGHLLACILRLNRTLKGVLYDQPQVVAAAAASGFITARAIAARCRAEGGDFFQSVPEGADGYLMKHIIHDWDDERCIRILENCRNAMAKNGKVLVIDAVIPKGNGPHFGKLLDINMMMVPGGEERTKEEFAQLFARAGLRLKRIIPTATPVSVLEAVRA